MTLQVRRCLDWRQEVVPLASSRAPFTRNARLRSMRAQAQSEGGFRRIIDKNEPNWGRNAEFFFSNPTIRLPSNVVANPQYSSLLRLTRRRYHELRMESRERVFLTMSDWVTRQVSDPSVEIDPHTVNGGVIAERKAMLRNTSSPAYVPPSSSEGGSGRAALIAAIIFLLVALLTAAVLALRPSKTADNTTLEVLTQKAGISGSVANGGARENVKDGASAALPQSIGLDTNFSETESDKAVTRMSTSTAIPSGSESPAFKPVPHYSTTLEQSELPLPPSLPSSAYTMGNSPPSVDTFDINGPFTGDVRVSQEYHGNNTTEDNHISHDDHENNAEQAQAFCPEADGITTFDEEVGRINGVTKENTDFDVIVEEVGESAIEKPSSAVAKEHKADSNFLDSSPTESLVSEPIEDKSTGGEFLAQLADKSTADSTESLPVPDEPLAQFPEEAPSHASSDGLVSTGSPSPEPDTDLLDEANSDELLSYASPLHETNTERSKESVSELSPDELVSNKFPSRESNSELSGQSSSEIAVNESILDVSSTPKPDAEESDFETPVDKSTTTFSSLPEIDTELLGKSHARSPDYKSISNVGHAPEPDTELPGEPGSENCVDELTTHVASVTEPGKNFHESSTEISVDEVTSGISQIEESGGELFEEPDEMEYYLIGDSVSLSPIGSLTPEELSQLIPKRTPQASGIENSSSASSLLEQSATKSASQHPASEVVGSVSATAQDGEDSSTFSVLEEPESQPVSVTATTTEGEVRRKEYAVLLEKSLPAMSVGVGVASLASFSGVNGALEVVGCLAAASVLSRIILWAGPRQQLVDDIKNIKDHKQLVLFLKEWNILPEGGSR